MSTTIATGRVLTGRDRAILAAVAAGRAEMTCSCEPDLYVDGLCCCDQSAAHHLASAGLITAAVPAPRGTRVPAVLTPDGVTSLAAVGEASA